MIDKCRAVGPAESPQSPTVEEAASREAASQATPNRSKCYGVTWKTTLLLSVLPLAVVTSTVPVVAPVGTVVLI